VYIQPWRKVTLEARFLFEFVVGNRAYPAGRYTFEMATGTPKNTTPGYATGCCRAALLARLLISC
jgi:hypothetical protein